MVISSLGKGKSYILNTKEVFHIWIYFQDNYLTH